MSVSLSFVNSLYKKTVFVDINSQYTQDGKAIQLYDTDATDNMLINLILTSPEELPFYPTLGTDVPALLFDNPTETTGWEIMDSIYYAAKQFLPFIDIDLNESSVYADFNTGTIFLSISYSVPILNTSNVLSMSLSPSQ